MNAIEVYTSNKLNDGRKAALVKAICDANRRGWTKQKVEQELITKAVHLDGLTAAVAREKMDDIFQRYEHEHGVSTGQINGTLVETLDDPKPIIEWDWLPIPMPTVNLTPQEQVRSYIEAVFQPGDSIAIDHKPMFDCDKHKANPTDPKRIIQFEGQTENWDVLYERLFAYDSLENGAFVIINPVNNFRGGKSDDDVMNFRHVLIECDHLPLELQLAAFRALNLPLSAVVYSGGRSIHGIMRIDAGRNAGLFKDRVEFTFDVLKRALVPIDTKCKNASRWSRLPGFKRNDLKTNDSVATTQCLLGTNWGASSFSEWEKQIIEKENRISSVVDFTQLLEVPAQKPELVEGIVRQGQKMLVSAPSKKGKSLLQIQLALALAAGTEWLGFRCRKTKALYCSLEGDSAETINRVFNIASGMGITDRANFPLVLNLDQARTDLGTLAKDIISKVNESQVEVVFIDPIYTLLGDEISSAEVKRLTKAISIIGQHTGAAVVFCHHSNKGIGTSNQGNHTDQISGSGVFGRFPDAIVTFNHDVGGLGKMLFTLRSFETPPPIKIKFEYPLFSLNEDHSTESIGEVRPAVRGRKPKNTEDDYRAFIVENPAIQAPNLAKHFDISASLAYEKLRQYKVIALPVSSDMEVEGI